MRSRLAVSGLTALLAPGPALAQATENVIYDTDFNSMGNDRQAFVMLAQSLPEKKTDLLGMTVVTGNQWLDQGVADALRAVERG